MVKKVAVDISSVAKRELTQDRMLREEERQRVEDSFTNFAQSMGVGADNALSSASYGFNPITRVRTILEWIHRGSWLGGMAVDVVADDMTRAGVTIKGEISPEDIEKINESITSLAVWPRINETIKWSRLYGGCIGVMMIDGQDYSTPLNIDTIGKGAFRGMLVLDRWMVDPSLNNLVTEEGPEVGMPKFYSVVADAPALPKLKIHHSRCLRLVGVTLPYWQRVMENLWGISILERLYDRMIAFDSATTGASQLVYKAYIRTYKIKGMRDIVSAGGQPMQGLMKYVEMMRRFQNIEGITLMDGDDEFEGHSHSAFSGLADALREFKEQLSGALQIPLVRLFGQSPSGFSSGDADLRLYYDGIKQKQNDDLKVGVTKVYRVAAMSEGIKVPDGFSIEFNSLWQLNDKEKSEIAQTTVGAVQTAHESGLISDRTALRELKQSSEITGIFTNITEADIEAADDAPEPPTPEGLGQEGEDPDKPSLVEPGEMEKKADGTPAGTPSEVKHAEARPDEANQDD